MLGLLPLRLFHNFVLLSLIWSLTRLCGIVQFLGGMGGGTLGSWGQIMENEFECLTDRRGLGGHFSEEFVKQNYSWPEQSHFP